MELISLASVGALMSAMLAGATTHDVAVRSNEFDPAEITVAPGDTIHWFWEGGPHTVTSGENCVYDGLYFDEPINSGSPEFNWVVPNDAPSTIPYFCRPHCTIGMDGVINVAAPGEVVDFVVYLDGSQVIPDADTDATGDGTLTLDTGTRLLSWEITYSDLEGTETASHIHGAAGYCSNSGVQVPLATGTPKIGSATLTDDQIDDLMAGLWYVNIHTDLHPAGEIRGQVMPPKLLDPIPSPIAEGDIHVELETIATGMTAPNWGAAAPGIDGRLFVSDQDGIVWNINIETAEKAVFLDVSDRLVDLGLFGEGTYDERGLLGVAFHPDYADNGLFYTYTSEPVNGDADFTTMPDGFTANHQSLVIEWQVLDPSDPDTVVDSNSARELLRIDQPQFNHDGGALVFGPDGMLYIALGDGGDADDEDGGFDPFDEPVVGHGCSGNGQNINSILGSILRIDPDGSNSMNGRYGVPADNPFVDEDGLDEIFAYGFRNPFRISFDSLTGDLYAGDVGQGFVEEIDMVVAGGNYGWNYKEGSFSFVRNGDKSGYVTDRDLFAPDGLIDPIAEYDHDEGISVIGGFAYRGSGIPQLAGRYVHGEFAATFGSDGRLFYLNDDNEIMEFPLVGQDVFGMFLAGFGQDNDGEIYVMANTTGIPFGDTGVVLRIQRKAGDVNADGVSNIDDIFAVLAEWGPCGDPDNCPADVNRDGIVDIDDLFFVLQNWG